MANDATIAPMPCPLCGRELSVENDYDPKKGRFHCPSCFATSHEAQLGWLPRAAVPRPVRSARTATTTDPTFAVDLSGREITRVRVCECGSRFTQRLLSSDYLGVVEAHSAGAIAAITRQIPDYFVPVHCSRCERIDLGRQARIDDGGQVRPFGYDNAAD